MALDYSDKLLPVITFDDRMTGASKLLGVKTTEDTADNAVLIDLNSLIGDTIVVERADWENNNGLVTFKGIQDCLVSQHNNLQGIQGLQGLQGIQGIQGDASLQLIGLQGIQGIQGIDGNQNSRGPQGLQGISEELSFENYQIRSVGISELGGLQGLQGLQGIQGGTYQGLQGIQGIQGIQGTYGKNIRGIQGPQGTQGTTISDFTGTDFNSYETLDWWWPRIFDCALIIKNELHASEFDVYDEYTGENLGPWLVQGFDPNLPNYNPTFIEFIQDHYADGQPTPGDPSITIHWESEFYITEDELHRYVNGKWGDEEDPGFIQVNLDGYQNLDLLDLEFSSISQITDTWYTGNGDNLVAIALPATCWVSHDEIFTGMSNLDTVGWPAGSIGLNDFAYCTNLKYVLKTSGSSDSIELINFNAFTGCSSLVYVAGITTDTVVEDGAFEGCTSFRYTNTESSTEVVHLKDYKSGVFSGCTSINKVVIDDNCEILEENALQGCTGITNISLSGYQYNNIYEGYSDLQSPFKDCVNLQRISGNTSLASNQQFRNIPDYIFSNIKSNNITFTGYKGFDSSWSTMEVIGKQSFYGSNIGTSMLIFGNILRSIGESAFEECTIGYKPEEVQEQNKYKGRLSINNTVNDCKIDDKAFKGSTLLTVLLTLNGGRIGVSAFEGCTHLTGCELTNIGIICDLVFNGCTSLADVYINNVNVIIDTAFKGCTGLKTIKYKHTSLFDQAEDLSEDHNIPLFRDSTSLQSITIYPNTYIKNGFFKGIYTLDSIQGETNRYGFLLKGTQNGTLSANIRGIGRRSFMGSRIANSTLEFNNIRIGEQAFMDAEIGVEVQHTQGSSVNLTLIDCAVDNDAFSISNSTINSTITSVTLTRGTIGDRVFAQNRKLTTISLTNVKSIGSEAFALDDGTSVLDITFGNGTTVLPRLHQTNNRVDVFGTSGPSDTISIHCTQSVWDMIDNESDTTGWKWLLDNHYIQHV